MTDATNVVAFAPRPKEAPPFEYVEFRLRDDCSLQVSAVDARGDIVVFEYRLSAPTTAGDLDRLHEAWARWRGGSQAAS